MGKEISNVVTGILNNIGSESSEAENCDYIGEDGLLYCGKCHTKKQTREKLPESLYGSGKYGIFHTLCKCKEEEIRKRMEKDEFDERMRAINRMKDASMMDSVYRKASFSRYRVTEDNKEVHKLAKNYADNFQKMFKENQGLLIYGPVGTGKSYTAACIANQLLENQTPVIMTSFVKIMQNGSRQDEAQFLNMLNSAKLLILDDLGAERNTDYAIEKVYDVIDSRIRASKPMILTTNLELADMLETTDIRYQRIYDRIFEICYPINLAGTSHRKNTAAQRFDRMRDFMSNTK